MLTFPPFRDEVPTPDQIKTARNDYGLTQAEAAWVMGVDQQTWQSWESGRAPMRPGFWDYWRVKMALATKKRINIQIEFEAAKLVASRTAAAPKALWGSNAS
jgi:DNA-binding XRE family transcriptional regulator